MTSHLTINKNTMNSQKKMVDVVDVYFGWA